MHQPFVRVCPRDDDLRSDRQKVIKANATEFKVGFNQQHDRRVGVRLALVQHIGFFELQPVPG